jgi:hypothetical protein
MILNLTDAGRAALINDEQNGTAARVVVSVGITATAFTFDATMTALPDETKRITSIAGKPLNPFLIHTIVMDNSADTFTVRGFGLYLDNGVLLGVYAQAEPIIEKSQQAVMLLQLDLMLVDAGLSVENISFGDMEFINPPATTDVYGVVRLSTEEEALAGTITSNVAITPALLKYVIDKKLVKATTTTEGIGRLATPSEAREGVLDGNVLMTPATVLIVRKTSGYRLGEVVVGNAGLLYKNMLDWNTTHPGDADADGWERALQLVMNYILYTSSTTYRKPAGLVYVIPKVHGSGGGGGQVQALANTACIGGGGGSGAYACSLLAAADIPDTVAITVGTGGPSGSAGGFSSFGNLVVANGGGGGAGGAIGTSGGASGGLGGVATAGQLRIPGKRGGVGWWPNTSIGVSGYGAESIYGAGGHPRILGLNIYQNGDNASGYGSGGSGAAVSGANTTYATGGLGAPGLVEVIEYIALT